jgi:transcriptional regulator GlxA family with amidase domain
MAQTRNVAIVLFDEVEVLDFAGPFEVFSVCGRERGEQPFNVYTVAEAARPVLARGGLSVNPHFTLADCPPPDIVLTPGGYGTRAQMRNPALLGWLKEVHARAELTLSVCTGALVLGSAGLLDGLKATTYHTAFDLLRGAAPAAEVIAGARWIDNGQVITSAGVSAGIDMALHVVERLLGKAAADETAAYMEYDTWPRA